MLGGCRKGSASAPTRPWSWSRAGRCFQRRQTSRMPRPLGDAVGERLELREYYADFRRNFPHAREFWKRESGQSFAEAGNASWEAFNRGDWAASLRLIEDLRGDLKEYFREVEAAGTSTYRVRIVSLPLTPYMQWELHVLRLRDEAGEPMRILL